MKKITLVAITLLALTSCKKEETWQCTTTVYTSGTNFGSHYTTFTTTFKGTKEEMLAYEKQQNAIAPNRKTSCR